MLWLVVHATDNADYLNYWPLVIGEKDTSTRYTEIMAIEPDSRDGGELFYIGGRTSQKDLFATSPYTPELGSFVSFFGKVKVSTGDFVFLRTIFREVRNDALD